MKYWEIIADRLHAEGCSWGYHSAVTRDGCRWIVDAHREERRYIVHSDELLSAFLETMLLWISRFVCALVFATAIYLRAVEPEKHKRLSHDEHRRHLNRERQKALRTNNAAIRFAPRSAQAARSAARHAFLVCQAIASEGRCDRRR